MSLLAATVEKDSGASSVLIAFGFYMVAVFALAWLAGRVKEKGGKEGFMSEYFLGSRGFGVWALALTAAATSASGGSFVGFPALIYSHGWVLALWIAGYMTVPLVAMALMGKRLNQVARRSGAITIPEIFRERFQNSAVGLVATVMIVVFLFFYLLAQFKAGAKILAVLLEEAPLYVSAVHGVGRLIDGVPWVGNAGPDYVLCLAVFGVAVIAYVTYGGFRAVVWTDVMQGIVMGLGVAIMLFLALSQVGGLGKATLELAEMTPPTYVSAKVEMVNGDSDLDTVLRQGMWIDDAGTKYRMAEPATIPAGETSTGTDSVELLVVDHPRSPEGASGFRVVVDEVKPYASGAGEKGAYTRAPGPKKDNELGYLAVAMAFCFFAFWSFGGVGQPHNMVRMMIFDRTKVLRRALVTVTFYFIFIYVGLILVFVCSRMFLPGMEVDPDRVMPQFAKVLTLNAGFPWLAGLVVAAPFAAVMSSVDSFLLLVSSGVVRDIYQRHMNPSASEEKLKKLSYLVTVVIGTLAVLIALNPVDYLQLLIVFASEGLAGCFLMPMILCLFWQRMTGAGAIAGMLGGAIMQMGLYVIGYLVEGKFEPYSPGGLQPFFWDVAASAIGCVVFSILSPAPDRALVHRFFARRDGA